MSDYPETWNPVPLGEVADFDMGQAPPGSECNRDGVGTPFVKAGEFGAERPIIREWTTKPLKFAKETDVLICVVGATAGKLNLGADCAIGRSAAAIRPSEAIDQLYLHRFLKTRVNDLRAGSTGSAQGVISRTALAKEPVPVAPLPEQRRIVAKLDRLSARSAAARDHLARTIKLATRAKQAIRGAAFDGSLSSDWREALGSPTPELRSLESVCASLTDGDHQAPPKADEGIAFITISAINDGYLRLEKATRYVPQSYRDGLKHTRQAVEGDIVFSVTGSIAIPALVDTSEPFVFQRHIAILKPDHDAVTSRYLLHILGATQVKEQALAVATGTAQLTIPLGKLRKFSIPIPPLEEQVEIVRRIDAAFARIDRMTEEASRAFHLLDRLDERLLAKAFRGELVPQDPEDEPAEALLTRIREARAAAPKAKRGKRKGQLT